MNATALIESTVYNTRGVKLSNYAFNRVLYFLSLAGVFVAAMLILFDWHIIVLPCSANGCDVVANWPGSKLVSTLGFIYYVALAVMFRSRLGIEPRLWAPSSRRIWLVATIGVATSAGLLYFADSVLHATCDWCLASAAIIGAIWLLSAFQASSKRPPEMESMPSADPWFYVTLAGLTVIAAVGFSSFRVMVEGQVHQREAMEREYVLPTDVKLHIRGDANAPITLIVFSDFDCPGCKASDKTIREAMKDNPGRIRFVYRHYPLFLNVGHEMALSLAAASEIVAEQGEDKFWKLHDLIFDAPDKTDEAALKKDVIKVGADVKRFESEYDAISSNPTKPSRSVMRVQRDIDDARKLNVSETPFFFVLTPDKKLLGAAGPSGLPRLLGLPEVRKYLMKSPAMPTSPEEEHGVQPNH